MSEQVNLEEALKLVGEGYLEDGRQGTVHLAETLWQAAIEGNMRAAKMILEYSIGRPALAAEATGTQADIGESLQDALDLVYGSDDDDDADDLFQWDANGDPVERVYEQAD